MESNILKLNPRARSGKTGQERVEKIREVMEMKQVSIRVSTIPIRFQSWGLNHVLHTLRFLFPEITTNQINTIGADYASFALSEESTVIKSYRLGDNEHAATIRFTTEKE